MAWLRNWTTTGDEAALRDPAGRRPARSGVCSMLKAPGNGRRCSASLLLYIYRMQQIAELTTS